MSCVPSVMIIAVDVQHFLPFDTFDTGGCSAVVQYIHAGASNIPGEDALGQTCEVYSVSLCLRK